MIDQKFFLNKGPFTIGELAEIGKCDIYPSNVNPKIKINNLTPIEIAGESDLTFIVNSKYSNYLTQGRATACIISRDMIEKANPKMILLISSNPYKSYALIAEKFYQINEDQNKKYDNNLSHIHHTARIGKNCLIEPFVYIGENSVIGDNVKLKANSYIGHNVVIGDNSYVGEGVTIYYAIIGKNVIFHTGVKIGQDGFGFSSDSDGHIRVPQLGRVIIENNVNIGANSCIDRGTNNDTIIGEGTQIDNLVQIGHNVQIGANSVIVSQVGIAGSTKIGKFALIGGQAGIAGHLKIGDFVQIAAKSGVVKDIEDNQIMSGMPAISINKWRKQVAILNQLVAKKRSY